MESERAPGSDEPPASPAPHLTLEDVHVRVRENRATGCALAKDTAQVIRQSLSLQERTRQACQAAKALRVRVPAEPPADGLYTIPQACHCLGIAERTLRQYLRAPEMAARLRFESRKVGTFFKYVQLIPTDLLADLRLRFGEKKS